MYQQIEVMTLLPFPKKQDNRSIMLPNEQGEKA